VKTEKEKRDGRYDEVIPLDLDHAVLANSPNNFAAASRYA
jgi:hypothetical protein